MADDRLITALIDTKNQDTSESAIAYLTKTFTYSDSIKMQLVPKNTKKSQTPNKILSN